MKVDNTKLNRVLAQRCMNLRDLREGASPHTLSRIRRGENVLPATLGRIAKALNVDVIEIMKED